VTQVAWSAARESQCKAAPGARCSKRAGGRRKGRPVTRVEDHPRGQGKGAERLRRMAVLAAPCDPTGEGEGTSQGTGRVP
jgi:hypothetical protein